jgi:hypothetical protein
MEGNSVPTTGDSDVNNAGSRLIVKVSITDTETAKQLIQILKEAAQDERIDQSVRDEYTAKISAVFHGQ